MPVSISRMPRPRTKRLALERSGGTVSAVTPRRTTRLVPEDTATYPSVFTWLRERLPGRRYAKPACRSRPTTPPTAPRLPRPYVAKRSLFTRRTDCWQRINGRYEILHLYGPSPTGTHSLGPRTHHARPQASQHDPRTVFCPPVCPSGEGIGCCRVNVILLVHLLLRLEQ